MMGRTSKSRFSISVITTGAGIASREYLMGVFKYANARTRWTFEFHNSVDEFSASHKHASSIDGILSIVPHTPASLSFIARKNIPTVIIDSRPEGFATRNARLSFLHLNDVAVGKYAAEHLISRGAFNSFACIIDTPETKYPHLREAGFRRAIERQKKPVATFILNSKRIDKQEQRNFRLRFSRLPKPLAVFAVRDSAALSVYEACRRLGLSIPDEVAVIGVDNDELFCNMLSCPLSSIQLDHEQVGFLASKELDRLLSGGNGTNVVFDTPVKDIVMRASTRIIPPAARIVSDALSYIEHNISGTLRVSEIAEALNISRRLLDLRFRQMENESVHNAIVRARIKAAKKRLASSRDTIFHIAAASGFPSSASFVRFFTHCTGMSPGMWREKQRILEGKHTHSEKKTARKPVDC
ncbi:MAG: substrate-binding domain-containing protein [Kiritimatiellae bacterium]|nr:substrate-binding domain-containing protein [Kiritimatiellia bacterium]